MTIIQNVDAGLTDLARELRAKGNTDPVTFGDWSFQVGTDGFDALDPTQPTAVDYSLQALSAPVGGTRYLGRVLSSGAAASVSIAGSGLMQVDGLASIPSSIYSKWLRISGSADPNVNGTWLISDWIDATSVLVYNPLATSADAGPLSWELREACIQLPNPMATGFHGRLLAPDGTVDGLEFGQVGIFGRVIYSPGDPSVLGLNVLVAVGHHPAFAKAPEMTVNYHVCIQG